MCRVPLLSGVVTISSASKGVPADRGGRRSVVASWPLRLPCILSHACGATLRHNNTCPLLSPVCHQLPQPSERAVSPAHLLPLCCAVPGLLSASGGGTAAAQSVGQGPWAVRVPTRDITGGSHALHCLSRLLCFQVGGVPAQSAGRHGTRAGKCSSVLLFSLPDFSLYPLG